MVSVNKKNDVLQLAAGLVPVAFSVAFLFVHKWELLLLCAISLFLPVAFLPLCRHRENLYMFIFVAAAGCPVNVWASLWLVTEGIFDSDYVIANVLWCILLFCVLFSVEQIAFAVITRLIWRKQHKIKM